VGYASLPEWRWLLVLRWGYAGPCSLRAGVEPCTEHEILVEHIPSVKVSGLRSARWKLA
jgi:hypothetical protein